MVRSAPVFWIAVCAAVLLAGGVPLSAQARPKPSSDLLLPYFEVGLAEEGTTTLFAISNTLTRQVDVLVTVHTNWGVQVLSVPVKLRSRQLWTVDLREWLAAGELPGGRELSAAELAHLQAVLTGQPSPSDGLYYSTRTAADHAVGSLTVRTLGSRPDALRGEFFLVDPDQGSSQGQNMADVDRAATPNGGCFRHNVRHVSGGGFGASQVTVWIDTSGQALPSPDPEDRRLKVTASAFSAAGKLLKRQQLRLLPVDKVSVSSLGLSQPLGRIVLVTDAESFVGVQAGGNAVFQAICAKGNAPTKPAVRIVTLVNNQDANTPPGPSIAIGSPVTWKYRVSNTGVGTLTKVAVSDDQGVAVKCPKTTLKQGEAMTCTARGVAEACAQKNIGTARATAGKQKLTAQDPSHYFGDDGSEITIEVATNGQDADQPAGPTVPVGSVVNWSYQVSNSGTVRLYEIEVTDSQGVEVTCPKFSLAPGEPMTCTAKALAVAGQYANTGTATAATACGTVTDTDTSHYFGESNTGLQLRALTNGYDADFPPGPSIPVDGPVTWEYVVTNSGVLPLTGVAVADDHGIAVSCPNNALLPGFAMTCLSRGVAMACQYSNYATVNAQTSSGQTVSASNASHYFGQSQAAIQIETATNGHDADLPPGPSITIGTPVHWTYTVTNLGKVALTGVQVTDDKGVVVTCPRTDLRPGESMACASTGVAVSGDYRNVGTVTALPPCGGQVSDDDVSYHRGAGDPGVRIQKLVNKQDVSVPPGPTIAVGETISWSYVVTNSGQLALTGVAVSDSRGVGVTCPKTSLQAGEAMTCLGSSVAEACQYDNLGRVTAVTPSGQTVTAVDPSYYFGKADATLQIETAVNGDEADTAPGPSIRVGSQVTWTYAVTNTGNVPVTGVQVSDDKGAAVSCPLTSLQPGDAMICTATGVAVEGQFRNVGTVSAAPPCGARVSAQDASHYFGGGSGAIGLQKLTNGEDANDPPGPVIAVGQPVTWTYRVTNTGLVSLTEVGVTDNRNVTVVCPKSTLDPGETMSCTGVGTAQACQYSNLGIASGKTNTGQQVNAVDPSYYFGQVQSSVAIETRVNGRDADTAPGPTVPVGSAVAWTYVVTNTGSSVLSGVLVSDPQAAVSCPKTSLQPGEQMTCTASGTAVEGPFQTIGRVTASPPCGAAVTAEDPAHYLGGGASTLQIQKLVNGQDAAAAPGPSVAVGSPMRWSYVVTNTGQVTVSQIVVTDDDPRVVVSCPKGTLQAGEAMTCTARGTAQACQYSNVGTASGWSASTGQVVTASDTSYYFGQPSPGLSIETATNGYQADAAPGPTIRVGSPVTWTYTVVNTGDVDLTGVLVSDSQGPAVTCPQTTLAPGASMICTATDTAAEGQYSNVGTVSATPLCGARISAQNPSHYFGGGDAGLALDKRTNNVDAATPADLTIPLGQPVSWTYRVTNTGQVALSSVAVTDNQGVAVTCPRATLAPGASMTCSGSGVAQACAYSNLGTATGKTATGQQVTAVDPSHYTGQILPRVRIETSVNGQEADAAPGPTIQVGSTAAFSYLVGNPGNAVLSNVEVRDSRGVVVSCPKASLVPGEQMTCTGLAPVAEGAYDSVGQVTADPPCGAAVTAQDPVHFFGGGTSGLQLQKLTNGQDLPWPGPSITVGQQVSWGYVVTNSGQVSVSNVRVTDSDSGITVTCPKTSLQAGEAMTCTGSSASGRAVACQYVNVATATARSATGQDLSAVDPSYYSGQFQASVQIETSVNGQDADTAPGPSVNAGSAVSWSYRVTNTSTVDLTNLKVLDDRGATLSCPSLARLAPGASITCTASGTAVDGAFVNVGSVTAEPPCGSLVSASDASNYFGRRTGIALRKLTNGQDISNAPGPSIPMGSAVSWSYVVTNTGSVTLQGIVVGDDQGVAVTCPKSELPAGESMACTGSGTAQACAYENLGTASGVPLGGGPAVTASDRSYYFGQPDAGLSITMSVDGNAADVPPGLIVARGQALSLLYVVKNTGSVDVTNVRVTDSTGLTVVCPKGTLTPNESMQCPVTITPTTPGAHLHESTARGDLSCGSPVVSVPDRTHYSVEWLDIERYIPGHRPGSESAPGPGFPADSVVSWEYEVSNFGQFEITNIQVTDSTPGVVVTCPATRLAPSATMRCTASGRAACGATANVATATGTISGGAQASDTDTSYYTGTQNPSVRIRSFLEFNGNRWDANDPVTRIVVPWLSTVGFIHEVVNTGDVPLTNVVVDDTRVLLPCVKNGLAVGEVFTCPHSFFVAGAGDYDQSGFVVAAPICGGGVGDDDPIYFCSEVLLNCL